MYNIYTMKTLSGFLKEHLREFFFGILFLIAVDLVQLLIPQVLRRATDELRSMSITTATLLRYAMLLAILAIVMVILRFAWRNLIWGTSRKIEKKLREQYFQKLQTMDMKYFNYHKIGDLMALATNDINAVRMSLGEGLLLITDAIFMISLGAYFLAGINSKLFISVFLPLPLITITVLFFGKAIHERFKRAQEGFAQLTSRVQESITGIRVVKAYGQEEGEIDNFKETAGDLVNRNMELARIGGIFTPLVQYLSSLCLFITLIYGGRLTILGEITLGDFIAFHAYLGLLTWPMMAMGWVVNILQRGKASLQRLNEVFTEIPYIKDKEDAVKMIGPIKGDLEFHNVTFRYPERDKPALLNISFKLKAGDILGVVGKLGSGKTTLLNLIPRLYDIEQGEIFLDGIELRKIALQSLRKIVSFIPQESFLFSDSIRENICFSDPYGSKEKAIELIKTVHIYEEISNMPQGIDTIVGERGITLSGGQKQRVAIARALYSEPKILIFDDAFSSLDYHTEEEIIKEMIKLKYTAIISSHRLSCLKYAREIIVLDEGEIIEQGNHEELISNDGFYAHLYRLQQLELEESPEEV